MGKGTLLLLTTGEIKEEGKGSWERGGQKEERKRHIRLEDVDLKLSG